MHQDLCWELTTQRRKVHPLPSRAHRRHVSITTTWKVLKWRTPCLKHGGEESGQSQHLGWDLKDAQGGCRELGWAILGRRSSTGEEAAPLSLKKAFPMCTKLYWSLFGPHCPAWDNEQAPAPLSIYIQSPWCILSWEQRCGFSLIISSKLTTVEVNNIFWVNKWTPYWLN